MKKIKKEDNKFENSQPVSKDDVIIGLEIEDAVESNVKTGQTHQKQNLPLQHSNRSFYEEDEKIQSLSLDESEIEIIYKSTQLYRGSFCLSILIFCIFFCYQMLETKHFNDLIGIQEQISTPIEMIDDANFKDVMSQDDLTNWLDLVLPVIFTDTPYNDMALVPPYLLVKPPLNSFLNLNQTQKVDYANFLDTNYFGGMRISTVYAQLKSSNRTIAAQVIPEIRDYPYNTEYHLKIPDKMDPISSDFVYQEQNGKKKRDFGFYGKGFVNYFEADQSLKSAQAQFKKMKDANWFNSEKSLSTTVEFIFYNNRLVLGIINSYSFFQSNTGNIVTSKTSKIFLPNHYSLKIGESKTLNQIKIALIAILFILIVVETILHMKLIFQKISSAMVHRINEFNLRDFSVLLQIGIFYALFAYGVILFGQKILLGYRFHLPLVQNDFSGWSIWSERFMTFLRLLGISSILQCLNLLLVASNYIPSLGILFETLSRSKANLFNFTLLILLLLVAFSTASYLLFGSRSSFFSTWSSSVMTNFQMFFGVIPYTDMYQANPIASATFYLIYVLFFCFFSMNIYTAIIIVTYQKLRVQKLLLSEAMARILFRQAKIKFNNWLNLFIFRPNRNYDEDDDKNLDDSESANETKQTTAQIFRNNWTIIKQKRIMTKEQFVINLKKMAQKMNHERIKLFEAQQMKLKSVGQKDPDSAISFNILKKSFIWLIYLIVCLLFYTMSTANAQKGQVIRPISTFLNHTVSQQHDRTEKSFYLYDVFNIPTINSYLSDVTHKLSNQRTTGLSKPVGDTLSRLNFRFYNQSLNEDYGTSSIFPIMLPQISLKSPMGDEYITLDERIQQFFTRVLDSDKFQQILKIDNWNLTYNGRNLTYVAYGNLTKSSFAQGGYVFTFNQSKLEKTFGDNITTVINTFVKENYQYPVGLVNYEFLLYNPNFMKQIYTNIEFTFRPSGRLSSQIFYYVDDPDQRLGWQLLTLFTVFCLYTLYLIVVQAIVIGNQWKEINKKNNKDEQQIQRSNCSRGLLWIGIDTTVLKGLNPVAIFVKSIIMIIKHFFKTIFRIIQSTILSRKGKILSYLKLLILFLQCKLISLHANLIVTNQRYKKFDKLERASLMATSFINYNYYAAIITMLLFINQLELLEISMISNLPILTVSKSTWSIINYIGIYLGLLIGEATAAYIVFGYSLPEFKSVQDSLYNILFMLNGYFDFAAIQSINSLFATSFFIYIIVIHWLLLLNIFVGLIKGQFDEEFRKIKENKTQGIFDVIKQILKQRWIYNYKEAKEIAEKQKQQNLASQQKESIDKDETEMQEDQPYIKCCFGCSIPQCCVNFFNYLAFEDQKEQEHSQMQDQKVMQQTEDNQTEYKDHDQAAINEKSENSENNAEVKNIPYKLDPDFKISKGLKPYLSHFDEFFEIQQQEKESDLEEDKLKFQKKLKRVALNPWIMKLPDEWSFYNSGDKPVSQTNFLLHIFDEQILALTRRQISLYDLRSFDTCFSSLLIQKAYNITKFQAFVIQEMQNPQGYQLLRKKLIEKPSLDLLEEFQTRFRKSPKKMRKLNARKNDEEEIASAVINYKYYAWQVIDQQQRIEIFGKLKQKEQLVATKNKDETNRPNPTFSIIEVLEQLKGNKEEELKEKNILLSRIKLGLKKQISTTLKQRPIDILTQDELTFDHLCSSTWKDPELNRVSKELREIWYNLGIKEKYELWYNRFNAKERVRLWNGLVFQINWFKRIVHKSKENLGPLRADLELLILQILQKKDEAKQKDKNKEFLAYHQYGPDELTNLWNTLYSNESTAAHEKKMKSIVAKQTKKQKAMLNAFEGGEKEDRSEDSQHRSEDSEHSSELASFSDIQNASNKKDIKKIDETKNNLSFKKKSVTNEKLDKEEKKNMEGKSKKKQEVEDSKKNTKEMKRFDQVQFFFKNISAYMRKELKEAFSLHKQQNTDETQLQQNQNSVGSSSTQTDKNKTPDEFPRRFEDFKFIMDRLSPQPEEERLPLWMLLTKREKFDMFFHQVVVHEAQMMMMLFESEHGEMGVDTTINQINDYDSLMETALNQQIFRKYLAQTRLEATRTSKAHLEKRKDKALSYDQDIIRYASFLKERYQTLERMIYKKKSEYEQKEDEIKAIKKKIEKIALGTLDKDEDGRVISQETKKNCQLLNLLMNQLKQE